MVSAGHLRIDGQKVAKPAHSLRPGATLTFPQARRVLVIRVLGLSTRRGPAPEAQALYDDLTPPELATSKTPFHERAGRPSKQDRRTGERFKRGELE